MADTQHSNAAPHAAPHGDSAHSGGHAHDPLSPAHLIGHVKDTTYIELPSFLGGKWNIPQLRDTSEPIFAMHTGIKALDDRIEPLEGKVTKFMVIEVVVAI